MWIRHEVGRSRWAIMDTLADYKRPEVKYFPFLSKVYRKRSTCRTAY